MIEFPTLVDKLMVILKMFLFFTVVLGYNIFEKFGALYILAMTFAVCICALLDFSEFTCLLIVIFFFNICVFLEFKSANVIASLREMDEIRKVYKDVAGRAIFLIGIYVVASIITTCLFFAMFYEKKYELEPQIVELKVALEEAEEKADSLQPLTHNNSNEFDIDAFERAPAEYGKTAQEDSKSNFKKTSIEYIGNLNSSIVHRSNCSSVSKMSPSNMVEFDSLDEALDEGYAPCKRCKP